MDEYVALVFYRGRVNLSRLVFIGTVDKVPHEYQDKLIAILESLPFNRFELLPYKFLTSAEKKSFAVLIAITSWE
jgi:hypothetical protein